MDINLDKAVFKVLTKDIQEICKPLFESFNTTYFNFVRRFDDSTEICLTTDPVWTEHFYQKRLYKFLLADRFAQKKTIINKLKVIPWTQFTTSHVRIAQSELFGVGIGLTLIFTRIGFTDFFHFGTSNENYQMAELYVSYTDCLIQFAYYFYDVANKIIAESSKDSNRLLISDRLFKKENEFPNAINLDIKKFMIDAQPKRFLIQNNVEQVLLTKKEIQCITFLTQGKTANDIGDILCMSKRTVETHLKNSRIKLGLGAGSSKSELISELYKRGFDLNDLPFGKL
jgi:DNA-binding CsgD family transcriptional regulator